MQVNNKTIVITGASSGIGEALCLELAKQNNTLILCARNMDKLQSVASQCTAFGSKAICITLDLNDDNAIFVAANEILKLELSIDILINNGGISQRSLASETPLQLDKQIMQTNYFGTIYFTKLLLPQIIKQKGGIVVISSIAGKFGFYLRSAYAASKFALHGFFESLRLELLKQQVQVTIVCPGKIKTAISYNAITKDGVAHNKLDPSHENAMDANVCAIKIIKAVQSNKHEVLIGGKELWSVRVHKWLPRLFFHLIKRVNPL